MPVLAKLSLISPWLLVDFSHESSAARKASGSAADSLYGTMAETASRGEKLQLLPIEGPLTGLV